jgi:DNA-binding response OmpR family regulator
MKILIIEDDKTISNYVAKGLRHASFTVDQAFDGQKGFDLTIEKNYDALIVDLMLPGIDGLSIIEDFRKRGDETPVLILSAKHTVDDRIKGLDVGGDDYLVKPFSFDELLARIHAILRRNARLSKLGIIEYSDLMIDLFKRETIRNGKRIEVQPREFELLEYFLQNAERVISKTMILERIWDFNFDPQTNVVEVLVSRLRRKIDQDFDDKLIHTVWGVGYVLKKEDRSSKKHQV